MIDWPEYDPKDEWRVARENRITEIGVLLYVVASVVIAGLLAVHIGLAWFHR